MKPKWQRARLLRDGFTQKVSHYESWVRIGSLNKNGDYFCNITDMRYLRKDFVELLARDENDFAEDVPLIPWKQFLKDRKS